MIKRIAFFFTVMSVIGCAKPANYLYPVPAPLAQRKVDPGPPGTLIGLITNAVDGLPIRGVSVSVHRENSNGPIIAHSETIFAGRYSIDRLDPGDYAVDFYLDRYVPILGVHVTIQSNQTTTLNETMTTILAAGQFRIVMNWTGPAAGAVRDVDSYLQVPGHESTPIGYANREASIGANLDHDNTSWSGPETITITDLMQGTYHYYVNNYNVRCDPRALGRSSVVVHVYQGSALIKTYTVPEGIGITYAVFDIVEGQIQDVQRYENNLPTYGGAGSCSSAVDLNKTI